MQKIASIALTGNKFAPFYQSAIWLLLGLSGMMACRLFFLEADIIYSIGATVLLSFAIFNAIISLVSKKWWRYAFFSELSNVTLTILIILLVRVMTMASFDELPEFKMIFSSIFLCHFLSLLAAGTIKKISDFLNF